MPDKPLIFLSHISEEAALAVIFKQVIEASFLNMVEVFVSTDNASISVGTHWLDLVTAGLKKAKVILLFCSPASIGRPWINFEAGAGWAREIEIVPVCHSGTRPVDLPLPLNLLQGIEAHNATRLRHVFGLIAAKLGSGVPNIDVTSMVAEVVAFETDYAVEIKATGYLEAIRSGYPEIVAALKSAGSGTTVAQKFPEWRVNAIRPALAALEHGGMLQYSYSMTTLSLGGPDSGGTGDLVIQPSPILVGVLQKRF